MTPTSSAQIREDFLTILRQIRDDWNSSIEVTEETGIFNDLGFESIDAVALGTALEEHFDRPLPFAEFLTRVKEQNLKDITVGRLLEFLFENLDQRAARSAT